MGLNTAMGFSEASQDGLIDLPRAIEYHLSYNHYPPVPSIMLDACIQAIDLANEADYEALVRLPDGVTWRGEDSAPAWAIIDSHHLEVFVSA